MRKFREARTVKAIGELRGSYPYAAALLSYVVVERVLKRYALNHWSDAPFSTSKLPFRVKEHSGKQLKDLLKLSRKQRLNDVLCRMTLGDVEALLKRPNSERSAADRNEVMHSNLYLQAESTLTKAEQTGKNRARFEKAMGHLRRVLEQYEGVVVVERHGSLKVQPNERRMLEHGYGGR